MFAAEQFRANLPQGREYYAIVGSDGYKKSCENKSTTCSTPEKMLTRVPMKKANFLYRNGCVLIKSRKKKCLRPQYLVKPRMPSLACEKLVLPEWSSRAPCCNNIGWEKKQTRSEEDEFNCEFPQQPYIDWMWVCHFPGRKTWSYSHFRWHNACVPNCHERYHLPHHRCFERSCHDCCQDKTATENKSNVVLGCLATTDCIVGVIGQPLFTAEIAVILQREASSTNCLVMELASLSN